ncbi:hypothetical protein FACS189494_05710 [Spirochaetia bacterium]|nr:hypothetical protein FACS189494_05710 [Spirochaetia bacterium]
MLVEEKNSILVVASFERGRGSGHLVRSCRLVSDLRSLGRDARLFLPKNSRPLDEAKAVIEQTGVGINNILFVQDNDVAVIAWGLIILDRFSTPKDEFLFFSNLTNNPPVLGIDEGGLLRDRFTFLVDLLPAPHQKKNPPNSFHAGFNGAFNNAAKQPSHKENIFKQSAPFKILVTFGGEDGAGLAAAVRKGFSCIYKRYAAAGKDFAKVCDVTIIHASVNINDQLVMPPQSGLTVIKPVKNLREQLCQYDLVITHIGLTAFEALCAGSSVLIVSPTLYHNRAALAAGFFSTGVGKRAARKAADFIFTNDMQLHKQHIDFLLGTSKKLREKYKLEKHEQTYSSFINSIAPVQKNICPVCGAGVLNTQARIKNTAVPVRFNERTFKRCPCCGTIIMNRLFPCEIQYTEKYFFENYKKQYGKTYLEDFPNLTAIAKQRLSNIKQCCKKTQTSARTGAYNNGKKLLLDIGCAYGAFLLAAQGSGFIPQGIDVSAEAVQYVNETLHITAQCTDFTQNSCSDNQYDCITLWYVIEHLQDVGAALKKIASMLNKDGLLAFSTPSAAGISAKKSMREFLENSPQDHLTIWNPRTVKKALKPLGFNVQKIIVTGHHPERFFPALKLAQKKKGLLYGILLCVSKLFSLGDTFEVYACKEN